MVLRVFCSQNGRRRQCLCAASFWLGLLVLVLVVGWMWGRRGRQQAPSPGQDADSSAITIDKQPEAFANRTFDPASPPHGMPPLPYGEQAECDSNFTSDASVGGRTRQSDPTHCVVTITQVKMTLGLKVNIWTPPDATPQVSNTSRATGKSPNITIRARTSWRARSPQPTWGTRWPSAART